LDRIFGPDPEYEYEGESVKEQIKKILARFCHPSAKLPSRGILLWGPPGTGKTAIASNVVQRVGITEVVHCLASTELNRPHVGETERLLIEIFQRALRVPHLLCCVSIDEIDALVPKRNEKTAGHKLDGLSTLLALIEGIKDVPNVIIIGSTNRRKQIDEAMLRRMPSQVFVGKPGPIARRNLFAAIAIKQKRTLDEKGMESFAAFTTNFSGAAILHYALELCDMMRNGKLKSKEEMLATSVKILCTTCEAFSVKIGSYYLPRLMGDDTPLSTLLKNLPNNCTGRALIDLCPESNNIQFETFQGQVLEEDLSRLTRRADQCEHRISFADVLGSIAKFCTNKQLDCIQLFDMDLLLSNSAFDDNTAFEILAEKLDEALQYEKVAVIIDAGSLIGVTENESMSSMGPTTSYSIQNHKMWSWVLEAVKKCSMSVDRQQWAIVVADHPYITKLFKRTMRFPQSGKELQEATAEEDKRTKPKQCKQCKTTYFEADNKLTDCKYHDGALAIFDDYGMTAVANVFNRPKHMDKMKYACCMQSYGSAGCANSKHSSTHRPEIYDLEACKQRWSDLT